MSFQDEPLHPFPNAQHPVPAVVYDSSLYHQSISQTSPHECPSQELPAAMAATQMSFY